MGAKEVAGHTKTCRKQDHGQYIGAKCPICAGIPKPAKAWAGRYYERELDFLLRRRPPGSRTDADGRCAW